MLRTAPTFGPTLPPCARPNSACQKLCQKDVIPDYFSEGYHEKVRAAFKGVDGMALSNLLGGRVFETLFDEVFSGDLEDRSETLVEQVKDFMQERLGALCDRVCAAHPMLLTELKTSLIEEFIDEREAATLSAIDGVIEAEVGWVFTQDPSFESTINNVSSMVDTVRKANDAFAAASQTHHLPHFRKKAKAVGSVPKAFITKMTECAATSDENSVYGLQVGLAAFFFKLDY